MSLKQILYIINFLENQYKLGAGKRFYEQLRAILAIQTTTCTILYYFILVFSPLFAIRVPFFGRQSIETIDKFVLDKISILMRFKVQLFVSVPHFYIYLQDGALKVIPEWYRTTCIIVKVCDSTQRVLAKFKQGLVEKIGEVLQRIPKWCQSKTSEVYSYITVCNIFIQQLCAYVKLQNLIKDTFYKIFIKFPKWCAEAVIDAYRTVISAIYNACNSAYTALFQTFPKWCHSKIFNAYSYITVCNKIFQQMYLCQLQNLIHSLFKAVFITFPEWCAATVTNAHRSVVSAIYNTYNSITSSIYNACNSVYTALFQTFPEWCTTVITNTHRSIVSAIYEAFNYICNACNSAYNALKVKKKKQNWT